MITEPKLKSPPPLDADQAPNSFYATELRSLLESTHLGQYVAIHADTHDYVVERGLGKAFREMKAKYPHGQIIVHFIGLADASYQARLRGEWPIKLKAVAGRSQ